MKLREYFRLSGLSVRAHRRQAGNTVRGLALGVVFLAPILFLVLSFYCGTISTANRHPVISSCRISNITQVQEQLDSFDGVVSLTRMKQFSVELTYSIPTEPSFTASDALEARPKRFFGNFVDKFPVCVIGDQTYSITKFDEAEAIDFRPMLKDKLEFYKAGDPTATEQEAAFLQENRWGPAILAGSAAPARHDEVLISSLTLDELGLPYDDVVGKNISYSYYLFGNLSPKDRLGSAVDAQGINFPLENAEKLLPVFKDYTIVGVFNAKLYRTPVRAGDYAPTLWLSADALKYEDGCPCTPTLYFEDPTTDMIFAKYTYQYVESPDKFAERVTDARRVFLPLGYNIPCDSSLSGIVQFTDFFAAYRGINTLQGYGIPVSTNSSYSDIAMLFPYVIYGSAIFLSLGGILFFTTVLNLYNTLKYSVKRRKGYLGMMKAIGMRSDEITKLYFFEILRLALRAFLWTLLLTFGICTGFTIGINIGLGVNPILFGMSGLLYFPAALLIVFALTLGVAFCISLLVCRNFNRRPIVKLLEAQS